MKITLEQKALAGIETEALVTYVFDDNEGPQGRAAELDQAGGGLLGRLNKSGELTGKSLETTLIHAPAGLKAARLLLIGAGKREQFNAAVLRKIAGVAARYLKARAVHNFVFAVRESGATQENAQAITEGLKAGALAVRPHDRYLLHLHSKLSRQKENLGIETPTFDLLQREQPLRALAAKRLKATLRVRKIQSQKHPQQQVKNPAKQLPVERLLLCL